MSTQRCDRCELTATPEIEQLRVLPTEMQRAALRAYGWDGIPTEYEFPVDSAPAWGHDHPRRSGPEVCRAFLEPGRT